jgi:hypothetical protein
MRTGVILLCGRETMSVLRGGVVWITVTDRMAYTPRGCKLTSQVEPVHILERFNRKRGQRGKKEFCARCLISTLIFTFRSQG